MSALVHYHGTPITPRTVLHTLAGRSFCVPYPEPRDVDICHEIGEGVMLDNGAFSTWTRGLTPDWPGYYTWAERWLEFPTTWAVIPDVIDGDAEANDDLIEQWPHGLKGSPVWHMHEPIDRLKALAEDWPKVCIGSSGAYRIVGSPVWTRRMEDAMDALCGSGPVPVWLHMLRGLDFAGSDFPFASADSTNVARNHAGTNSGRRRRDAAAMAAEIDARQCPSRWRGGTPLPASLLEGIAS